MSDITREQTISSRELAIEGEVSHTDAVKVLKALEERGIVSCVFVVDRVVYTGLEEALSDEAGRDIAGDGIEVRYTSAMRSL